MNGTPDTLGSAVAAHAQEAPDRPALFHSGTTIGYGELDALVGRAAAALHGIGVRRGERIGILLGNSPEWVVTCLGAARIGAVVVGVNTWFQPPEIEWTLRHAAVSVLVTTGRFLKRDFGSMVSDLLPELRDSEAGALHSARLPQLRSVVMVDQPVPGALGWSDFLSAGSTVTGEELAAVTSSVTPDDDMFVVYTSGSTANPKGVRLAHGNLVRNGTEVATRRWIDEHDRIWLGAPLFYGLGAGNALPVMLSSGASLLLQDHFDAGDAIAAIAATGATTYYGTGNMTQAILDHPTFAAEKVRTLEKGIAGISAHYKSLALDHLGVRYATPAYGLTETYGHITGGMPDDPVDVKLTTDGSPLPGIELRIVDPVTRQELPAGEPGLVLVRGRVTPGYLDNPVETERAIRPDGFFDTGDLGHLDSAGRLVYRSRLKDMIKSKGVSISPREIENLLVDHPDVTDAFVVGVPHRAYGEVIVAFVTVSTPVAEAELRTHVANRAASFKVPHRVLVRASFPRLASGKVASRELADLANAALGS
jgi:fatty-acyl-CoA synthase